MISSIHRSIHRASSRPIVAGGKITTTTPQNVVLSSAGTPVLTSAGNPINP